MNCRAKFDAASFIPGGEILNRTNTQTNKNQTVTDIYIHTLPFGMCRMWIRQLLVKIK